MKDVLRFLRILFWVLVGIAVVCFALYVALNTMNWLETNKRLAQVLPPNVNELIEQSAGDGEILLSLILEVDDGRYALKMEELYVFSRIDEERVLWLGVPFLFESDYYNVSQRCWKRWGRSWGGLLFYKLPGQWWRFGSQVCAR
jgi:hypothetical protein